jgi:hypothetical protein
MLLKWIKPIFLTHKRILKIRPFDCLSFDDFFFLAGKITFNVESVDPKGIGGGRKECNINNQAIIKLILA